MAFYTCDVCGMSIGTMTCGQCGAQLEDATLDKEDGGSVRVAKCPNGHGMVKSPQCCGTDMTCQV